jgi:hypothetical protein
MDGLKLEALVSMILHLKNLYFLQLQLGLHQHIYMYLLTIYKSHDA